MFNALRKCAMLIIVMANFDTACRIAPLPEVFHSLPLSVILPNAFSFIIVMGKCRKKI